MLIFWRHLDMTTKKVIFFSFFELESVLLWQSSCSGEQTAQKTILWSLPPQWWKEKLPARVKLSPTFKESWRFQASPFSSNLEILVLFDHLFVRFFLYFSIVESIFGFFSKCAKSTWNFSLFKNYAWLSFSNKSSVFSEFTKKNLKAESQIFFFDFSSARGG